jgi:uncharacterized membrane protein
VSDPATVPQTMRRRILFTAVSGVVSTTAGDGFAGAAVRGGALAAVVPTLGADN